MKLLKIIHFLFLFFIVQNINSQITYKNFLPVSDGNVLFNDEFNDNSNEWFTGTSGLLFSQISDGLLIFGNNSYSGSWAQWRTFYLNQHNEFSIEARIKQYGGNTENSYGLIWGATGWDNLFCFTISSNGFYRIFKIEEGNYIDIKTWSETDSIFPKYFFNKLNISYRNDTTFFYVNNLLVYFKKNLKMYGPKSGIFIDGKMKVKVDYFKIIHPEITKNVTGYPITTVKSEILDIKQNIFDEIKSPVYLPEQKKLFISIKNSDDNFDIYYSEKNTSGKFSELQLFDTTFNSNNHNFLINYNEEDNSLILCDFVTSDSLKNNKIEFSVLDSVWSEPKQIIVENTYRLNKNTEIFIADDKKTMLLTLTKSENYGHSDIYVSFLNNKGQYSEPLNIGKQINLYADEKSPFLCSDNKTMFFASNSLPGFGGYDIFVTQRIDDTWTNWTEPHNLGPVINTTSDETELIIDNSNNYGFFISNIEGNSNIYQFLVFNAFFKNLKFK